MQHLARIVSFCALSVLLVAGCGETTETPPGTGGTGAMAGTGGTGAMAGTGGTGAVAGTGGTGAVAGTGGTGGAPDPCATVDCSDQNDCTIDPTCNPANGACEGGGHEPVDTRCDGGSFFCDGSGACVACNRDEQCPDDGNECTDSFCVGIGCVNVGTGGSCTYMGGAGVCQNGICISANQCVPYPCENRGACVVDECNPTTGTCSYTNRPVNTRCLKSGIGYCDSTGRCVPCNEDEHCDDGNACTSDTCITGVIPQCLNLSVKDGVQCDGSGTACVRGRCLVDTLDRDTFSGNSGTLAEGIWTWWPARDWLTYEFYPYGLAAFYFNFTGSGVDHELEQIRAGFYLDEYLPNILGMETAGWALYQDRNADDPYNWEIDAQRVPVGSTEHQLGDCMDHSAVFNKEVGSVPPGYLPVLLGFDLDRETDHNVEQIQVRLFELADVLYLSVYFTDASSTDPICYSVSYALVPAHRIRVQGRSNSSSAGGGDAQPIDAQHPILQGFNISYSNDDHHIDEFGVRLVPGRVSVWLNDKNDDDPFGWTVWWADLQ